MALRREAAEAQRSARTAASRRRSDASVAPAERDRGRLCRAAAPQAMLPRWH